MLIQLNNKGDVFKGEDYGIEVLKVAQEFCSPHKLPARTTRQSYALHFVAYGSGTLCLRDGTKFHIGKGMFFLLYEGEEYVWSPDSSDPWCYIWVDFCGREIEQLFSLCGFEKSSPVVVSEDVSGMIMLMRQMLEGYDASDLQQFTCSVNLLLIIDKLIRQNFHGRPDFSNNRREQLFRNLVIYINNNCRLDLSLQSIADQNGISMRTLVALFSEVLGMGPIQYLNRFRISLACEIMQKGEHRLASIAEYVGFKNGCYFSTVFKKIMGISPKEYRMRAEKGDPFLWLKEKNLYYR